MWDIHALPVLKEVQDKGSTPQPPWYRDKPAEGAAVKRE